MKKLFFAIVIISISLLISSKAFASTYYEISDGSVKALYHFEGNGDDSSVNDISSGPHSIATSTGLTYATSSALCVVDTSCGIFSGSNHVEALNASTSLPQQSDNSGKFTITGWVRWHDTGAHPQEIVGWGNRTATHQVRLLVNKTTNNDGVICLERIGGNVLCGDGSGISADTWHYVTITGDGATLKLYQDGTFITSTLYTILDINIQLTPNQMFFFGSDNDLSLQYQGRLDEFAILNKDISSSDISNLYNGGAGAHLCASVGCAAAAAEPFSRITFPQDSTTLSQDFSHFHVELNSGLNAACGYVVVHFGPSTSSLPYSSEQSPSACFNANTSSTFFLAKGRLSSGVQSAKPLFFDTSGQFVSEGSVVSYEISVNANSVEDTGHPFGGLGNAPSQTSEASSSPWFVDCTGAGQWIDTYFNIPFLASSSPALALCYTKKGFLAVGEFLVVPHNVFSGYLSDAINRFETAFPFSTITTLKDIASAQNVTSTPDLTYTIYWMNTTTTITAVTPTTLQDFWGFDATDIVFNIFLAFGVAGFALVAWHLIF